MSRIVFVLGAGASREAGAPLMLDFLDVASNLLRTGRAGQRKASFEAVFKGIGELQLVHSKAQLDIQNLESVFAAFEMARIVGKFGNYSSEEINCLADAMNDVIVGTLESTLPLPVRNRRVLAPPPYGDLVDLIGDLVQKPTPGESVAVVTFNYDMAADYAFHVVGGPITYALGEPTRNDAIPLLKLHGSLNWAKCCKCGAVVPWPLGDYFRQHNWPFLLEETTSAILGIATHLQEHEHCGEPVHPQPVIVPPTWNKSDHHLSLSQVWARAAKEMGEAESIFVIGYSLPPSDAFFRYLYALGTVGRAPRYNRKLWIGAIKEGGVSLGC